MSSGADPDPACHFDAVQDPEPTFHFDANANPDLDPSFQIKAQNLEKVLKQARLQIDADPDLAYHFDADPDPAFQFDPDPCGSGSAKLCLSIFLNQQGTVPT